MPVTRPGEVLVKVHAVAVHGVELAIRSGKLRRVMRAHLPHGLGGDFAGEVEAVGSGVAKVRPGDRVWGLMPSLTAGSAAEFVVVPQQFLALAPKNISLVEAAALPLCGAAALHGLTRKVQLRRGDRLLVRGAADGIGVVAVQLGRAFGAHVTALAEAEDLDIVGELGADVVADHRTTEPGTLGRFDVVLDLVGGELSAYRKILNPRGRLVALAVDPQHVLRSLLQALAPRTVTFASEASVAELAALTRYVERRLIRPAVAGVLPMAAAAEAHRRQEKGGVRGCLVLDVGAEPESVDRRR